MPRGRCFVEKDVAGNVVRIFRTAGAAATSNVVEGNRVTEYPRKDAVESIRLQVFARANSECEYCGDPLTWKTMHMHEKKARGDGGEISVYNSVALCYECHINGEHGNRKTRFGE